VAQRRWVLEASPRCVLALRDEAVWRRLRRVSAHVAVPFLTAGRRDEVVAACRSLERERGVRAVCHVPARRFAHGEALLEFCHELAGRCGVEELLLLGGDPQAGDPSAEGGAWGGERDGVAALRLVLRDAALAERFPHGLGVAGYPDGHAAIPEAALDGALAVKLGLARALAPGRVHVVSQLALAPASLASWAARLAPLLVPAPAVAAAAAVAGAAAAASARVPLHVGLIGPSSGAALRAISRRVAFGAPLEHMLPPPGADYSADEMVLKSVRAAAPCFHVRGFYVSTFDRLDAALTWVETCEAQAVKRGDSSPAT
jgi:5,10-methylenetetrahydrofolate reductase